VRRLLFQVHLWTGLTTGLTGLVIWWPGRANWRGAAGIWTVAFIAMWAFTGLSFTFPREFRQAVHWLSPVSVGRAPLSDLTRKTGTAPSGRLLLDRAQAQQPSQFAARIVTPSSDTGAFLAMFSAERPRRRAARPWSPSIWISSRARC
jgi:hypothetical protein